jgi:hypothetical protein
MDVSTTRDWRQFRAAPLAVIPAILLVAVFMLVPAEALGDRSASQLRALQSGRIDAGDAHTCAILTGGAVRCWGEADSGRLGYGNLNDIGDNETPDAAGPVNLGAGRTAVAITAGSAHTCALLDNSTVRCWGEGDFGRLGYGNVNDIGDNETPGSVGPVDLGTGRTAVEISAGGAHTCARLDNGTVRCWGWGGVGALGYGNTNDIGDNETPGSVGPVDLGTGRTAAKLTAGGFHTCAVLDNAAVRCWGFADFGALGYGNTNEIGDDETPGSVGTVDLGVGRTAEAIEGGGVHTCALLDDANVRCWGFGSSGRLGYGNTNTIGDNETPGSVGPVNVGTGRTTLVIAAGGQHSCAVLDNDTVRCWGEGDFGRLGYGNINDIGDNEAPGSVGPVSLGTGRTAVTLSAGGLHTCVVLDNGAVRCWGEADSGRLGYGNLNDIGDNELPSSVGTLSLGGTVDTSGEPPTAVGDSATVSEDSGPTAIDVLANDTDPDGGEKTISSASDPANGTVVLTGGSPGAHTGLTYAPDPDYCNDPPGTSTDDFTYTLNGGSTATVSVTVTCVDDDPVAVDDSATVAEDSGATAVDVLANDTDVDGGPKTIDSVTQPANGAAVITGGGSGLTYQPDPDYCNDPPGNATDDFTYTLNGGSTATVSVTVTCVDDDPVAVDDSATVAEDSGPTAIDVLTNDTDVDGGPKTIDSVTQPANGAAVITGGGSGLTYQPDPDYCNDPPGTATDDFTYTLNGGSTATVSVTVTCDEPPTAVDDSATVTEDSGAAIDVLANDIDPDGGEKTISSASDPANGTVVLFGGSPGAHTGLTYAPAPDYCNDPPGTATDDFTYTLNGGSTATVSVTVTCVDDDPVAVDDAATVSQDSGATAIDVLANDTDVDGGPRVIQSSSDPANGTVVITGGGSGLTYRPDPGYCNDGGPADTFTYTLNGGSTATVLISVTCAVSTPPSSPDPPPSAPPPTVQPPAPLAPEQAINVQRYVVPRSIEKLRRQGVRVKASCVLDCRIVVTVRVTKSVAKRLRLKKPVVARGSARAAAGRTVTVRARLTKPARRAFRTYSGGGRLQINVRAK